MKPNVKAFVSVIAAGLIAVAGVSSLAQTHNASSTEKAAQPASEQKAGTTLEDLQKAYDGESNAQAKYLEYARKADEEGYGKVASLFRAASDGEAIHAKNHAEVIKKLGGTPKADIKKAEAKTTRENLQDAINGETHEFEKMYPEFMAAAKLDNDKAALKTFTWAKNVEAGHAKLYKQALDNLEQWKGGKREFFVCQVCGNAVEKVDFDRCPVCREPKKEYKPIS